MDAIDAAAEQLVTRATRAVASREHQIDLASARVKAVDPQETLKRGYALIWNETRTRLLRSIEEAPAGTMMAAELRDGYLHAEVSKAESKDESEAEPSQQAD